VDPTRSNGVPLNPQFRNPSPGSNEPFSFVDPVTIPAGDIADNPYWKRDARRSYPRLSTVTQGDVVALLSVGSESAPKKELIGDAGIQALVAAKEEGKTGLAAFFQKDGGGATLASLGRDGLPPLPRYAHQSNSHGSYVKTEMLTISYSGASLKAGADKYNLTDENAYPEQ
jgi:hypothetical protein